MTTNIQGGATDGCVVTYAGNTCPHTDCNWQCNPQESIDICEDTAVTVCLEPILIVDCIG